MFSSLPQREAPVNDMLQYHDQVFQHPRFITKYQGTPTRELDQEWEALYNRKFCLVLLTYSIMTLCASLQLTPVYDQMEYFTLARRKRCN